MSASELISIHEKSRGRAIKLLAAVVGIGTLICVAILGISIATLIKVNNGFLNAEPTPTSTVAPTLVSSIQVEQVMGHLTALQRIATVSNGNRAVNTIGFNQTLDYIYNQLTSNTDFTVLKSFFYLRNFRLASNPIFITSINGTTQNRTYSTNLTAAEFYHVQYSRPANFASYTPITVIPNLGCEDADWQSANPSPANRIALVIRGDCTFAIKAAFAEKYNVATLLFYNDGTASDRIQPIYISLGQANELPALFLSYTLGKTLADAAAVLSSNVGVSINIVVADERTYPVGNICADTKTGDATQTIVIGSHSDSVPAGPGINDNGSGSSTNLALAIALARLFQTSAYPTYKYRVRFCWFGAEELGLLGSNFHVQQAMNATTVGDRVQDYLINLNYDMLGSPNYIFGIYDGKTANSATPPHALPGSYKTTDLFKGWFEEQNLPWDYTDFSGRSDYGPFLAAGIVAGGLFTGADERKTQEQRDRYDRILGAGMGGIAGVIQDPCYHQACDSIQNINVFALDKMAHAAAYVLEYLGRQDDLKTWLYPPAAVQGLNIHSKPQRKYNSINEYFGLPYL